MATVDDVEVANASFPNVRQDLNDILEALATNFSADAEPTTTYPNQFWYETDANLLYIRNEADDAWITLASINQTSGEWEPRTAVIQAVDSAGVVIKTDDGTTRLTIADDGTVTVANDLTVNGGDMLLDSSGDSVFTMTVGGTSNNARIDFNNGTSVDGGITYDHDGSFSSEKLVLRAGNNTEHVHLTGDGYVGIGLSAPQLFLDPRLAIGAGSSNEAMTIYTGTSSIGSIYFADGSSGNDRFRGQIRYSHLDNSMRFAIDNQERMRLTAQGNENLFLGKTSQDIGTAGIEFFLAGAATGATAITRVQNDCLTLNRTGNDGVLQLFYQDGTQEGSISVSGTTVSYNGGHLARWSQTADDLRIDGLVKGTVLSNLDAMCEWKRVEFDYQALVSEAVEAQDEVLDEEGNVVQEAVEAQDAVHETRTTSESYDGDANVGDVVDWTYQDQDVQATVILEDNEQLNRMKVSDVEGDPNVAGVFVNWDDDDDVNTADMNIAMTGDMVIRIAQGTTVARGDLLMSAGDGTAKPQGDDIVRSKTIAKVTSTHVSHTYDDGSYLVPCVLMAC